MLVLRETEVTEVKCCRFSQVLHYIQVRYILSLQKCASSTGTPNVMSVSPEDSYITESQTQPSTMNSRKEVLQNTSNVVVIGGAVGGSLGVIVIATLVVAVVLLVRSKQRLEAGQCLIRQC